MSLCRNIAVHALPLLLASAAAGCAGADLGDRPFLCNFGDPQCPDGYVCQGNVCVREGSLPDLDLGRIQDKATRPTDHRLAADGTVPQPERPKAGDQKAFDRPPQPDKGPSNDHPPSYDQSPNTATIVISEFLASPKAVADDVGEWLELHNLSAQDVDLKNWRLRDDGVDHHVISTSVVLPANGYVVLGRSTDTGVNGGAPVQYSYGSDFLLANTGDEIYLMPPYPSTTITDKVIYSTTAGWTISNGASLSLKKSASSDHSNPANWCTETKAWTSSKGDKGTPGAAPGC